MKINSKNHLVEYISRNTGKLESGLQFLDRSIETVGKDLIDILAIDKDDRIVIMLAKEEPQAVKGANIHILKESIVLWDWIVDQKEDYFTAVKYLTGRQPARIPPRLFVIAPSYDEPILRIAKSIEFRIDIEVFEYSPDNLKESEPFKRIDLKDHKIPTKLQRDKLIAFADAELSTLRDLYTHQLKHKVFIGFEPVTKEDFIKNLTDKNGAKQLADLIIAAEKHDIVARPKKDQMSFVNELGETVARVSAHQDSEIIIEIVSESENPEVIPITDIQEIIDKITAK